jgi:RHS repeat-associated protein
LTEARISRGAAFPGATATYTPPPAGAAQPTQQTVLADDVIPVSGGYDAVDNPITVLDQRIDGEWPVGAKPVTTRTYGYDDAYRVTSVANTYKAGTDLFVPPVAATTAATSPFPLAAPAKRVLSQSFKYDGLGNTIATGDDATTFFDRSLGKISNGGTASAPGPNQLQSATEGTLSAGGALSATYDAAGNMVQLVVQRSGACTGDCNQLFQYDWDEVGRLARARRFDFVGGTVCYAKIGCVPNPTPGEYLYPRLPTTPANADVSYSYDAGGTRVLRASTPSGEGPTYSAEIFPSLRLNHAQWDATSATYDESVETEAVYLTFGGSSYGRVVYDPQAPAINGPLHVFLELTDSLSSVSTVIDKDTSELVERTTFLAYGGGDSDYRPDRWQGFREEYKFTGKEDDVEVGLTYFGARYYSAQLGRWVSPDPLAIHGIAGDLNPYAYVRGRVVRSVDATGLDGDGDGPEGGTPLMLASNVTDVTVIDDADSKKKAGDLGGKISIPGVPPNFPLAPTESLGLVFNEDRRPIEPVTGEPLYTGPEIPLQQPTSAPIQATPDEDQDIREDHENELRSHYFNGGTPAPGEPELQLGIIPVPGPELAPLGGIRAAEAVTAYEVGSYEDLVARSPVGDDLAIHHVGQAHAMEEIVPGYERATGPSIALPTGAHRLIPNLRGTVALTPRQLLARDIWNLRTYTNTPNNALQQLIQMNKDMYPEVFTP